MPMFVTAIAVVQPSIASTISVSSQPSKTTNIAQDNESVNDYLRSGVKKYNSRDFKGAISDFDRAINLNPKFAMSYNNRGVAKYKLEDIVGAATDWYKAAELYRQQGNMVGYQKVMKEIKDATKAAEDAVHSPQVDRTKLDAFEQKLLELGQAFSKAVKALTYHGSDGTEGVLCVGSGRSLEDRRLYIDEFIARNMYLLSRGSADYNMVIEYQNSLIEPSNIAIHACDYLHKSSNFD
jgi:tetratricopeptide (TPR) repeat protein